MPGATGTHAQGSRQVEPSPRRRKQTPSDTRRKAERAVTHQRRQLEAAETEIREIRNERNPLARRHLPTGERHIPADELVAKDFTRPLRVERVQVDIDHRFAEKRGEA